MDEPSITTRFSTRAKWMIGGGFLLLVYTFVGFFLIPVLLKSQLEKKLPPLLHRNVAVQEVAFNPYVLSLRVKGFRAMEPGGGEFASFEELFVNFQLSSIFERSLNFKEITLMKPAATIILYKGGKANFDDLVSGTPASSTSGSEPSKPPKIKIDNLLIDEGTVTFADLTRTTNFQTRVHPIQISLTHFSSEPDANNPYAFRARMDPGTTFSWSGNFSVNPLRSDGTVTLSGVQVKSFSPYYGELLRFDVVDGEVKFQTDYHLDASTDPQAVEVKHAAFELKNLKLIAPDTQETVIALPSLVVKEVDADLMQKAVKVDSVSLADGSILTRRHRDGTLNLLRLRSRSSEKPQPGSALTAEGETKDGWHLTVKEVKLGNFNVTAEDQMPSKTARMTLDQLNLTLNGLAFPDNTPIATEASLRWNEKGTISATGTLRHSPVFADFQVRVKDFDLRPFQPYLGDQVNLKLARGAVNARGRVVYASPERKAPLVRFTGDFALNQLETVDTVSSQSFVKWDALTLARLTTDVSPTNIRIDELKLNNFRSNVVVEPDGRSNLATILRSQPADTSPKAEGSAKDEQAVAEKAKLTIKTILLENAVMQFTDQSIQPHITTGIQKLSGHIRGLSMPSRSRATVELTGDVDAHAPVQISGQLNLLGIDSFADLTFALKGLDVVTFSPYSGKFAGYPLEKGKLSVDLRYKLAERKLDGENVVLVDQLTLGPKTDSPDATSLPVKLALAILTDRNSKIHLDVPVSGGLDDPEFTLGRVILKAFLNILEKVATSPFALLGAVVGSSGEDLSFVHFAFGSGELSEGEAEKLAKLAKALFERPGLKLEITPSVDLTNDRQALALERLRRLLKQIKLKEATEAKLSPSSVDKTPLEGKEYERLVRLAYARVLGGGPPPQPTSTEATPEVKLFTQPASEPEEKSGFWEFLSRLNPFRAKQPAKKEPHTPTTPAQPQVATSDPRIAALTEISLAEMERKLLEKQEVTDNDLNKLIQDRAKTVQGHLLQAQDLGAERIFIVIPKSQDAGTAGASQVTLSLN